MALAHLQQPLDFRGGKSAAAAAVERNLHVEPIFARAPDGNFRGDDLDLFADIREA